jgi:hypothetical protein
LVTPAAIFLTIENVRAEWMWRNERARLVAQGERLTVQEILGPEVPPDQNAAAAPIFVPFFDYQNVRGGNGERTRVIWRDTNALQQFDEKLARPDKKHWPKEDVNAPSTPKMNLAMWAEAYRHLASAPAKDDPPWAAELKLPAPSAVPASVVLAGLAVADEPLAAVCAASTRPRARFPLHFDEGFDLLLRHVAPLKAVSLTLELRCAARLALGETNAAFADAQCALRASELLREEPLLISQLVRIATTVIAVKTVWQGLAGHEWTDAQLAAFQDQLGRMNLMSGTVTAFEGERTCSISAMERWVKVPGTASREMSGDDEPGGFVRVLALLSRGIMRQNEIGLVRYATSKLDTLRTAISNAPQTGLAGVVDAVASDAALAQLQATRSPYRAIFGMIAQDTGGAVAKTARAQTILQMAVVACALERYHLRHGAFPEKLDELAPAFLPKPPVDPMTLQPFHYQRTDDGWFQLYSVGADGKDDGGVFMVKTQKGTGEKDWPWPVPTRPERYRLF